MSSTVSAASGKSRDNHKGTSTCTVCAHIVEVRLSDTDRGLEMFYGLFPHYYDNICVMLFFKPLYLAF